MQSESTLVNKSRLLSFQLTEKNRTDNIILDYQT